MTNILTVDVESWSESVVDSRLPPSEIVVESTRQLVDVFADCGATATFFILGSVAEAYPQLVQHIDDCGHEVALHGRTHDAVWDLSIEEFRCHLVRGRAVLEDQTNHPVVGYRAPYFSVTTETMWALRVLSEEGFVYDSSVVPAKVPGRRYGISEAPPQPFSKHSISEYPLSVLSVRRYGVPLGGGYLRVLPYRLLKWRLDEYELCDIPAVVYLHPHEIATRQVKNSPYALSLTDKIWHNFGRSRQLAKVTKMITDFEFNSIRGFRGEGTR